MHFVAKLPHHYTVVQHKSLHTHAKQYTWFYGLLNSEINGVVWQFTHQLIIIWYQSALHIHVKHYVPIFKKRQFSDQRIWRVRESGNQIICRYCTDLCFPENSMSSNDRFNNRYIWEWRQSYQNKIWWRKFPPPINGVLYTMACSTY